MVFCLSVKFCGLKEGGFCQGASLVLLSCQYYKGTEKDISIWSCQSRPGAHKVFQFLQ